MSSLQFRGVTYPNAKVACDQLNISYADFNRLASETDQTDLGCIEILYKDKYEQPESRKKLLDKPISIKNFKYRSVWEACKMLNLCPEYVLLTGHINKQDLDEAIKMLQRLHIRGFIDSTPSLKELLEKYATAKDPVVAKAVDDTKPEKIKPKDNVVTKTKEAVAKLSKWIQEGQPKAPMLDDIVKEPEVEEKVKPSVKKGRPGTSFEFEGNTYSSIADFCSTWNVGEGIFSTYRRKHPEKSIQEVCRYYLDKKAGADTSVAAEVPKKTSGLCAPSPVVYKGVTYSSMNEFAKAFGYNSGIVVALRGQHPDWTDEQIYGRVAQGRRNVNHRIEHNGEVFTSIEKFAVHLGFGRSYFYKLHMRHPEWTNDEIIEAMKENAELRAKGLLKIGRPKAAKKEEAAVPVVEPVTEAVPEKRVTLRVKQQSMDTLGSKLKNWRLAGPRTKMTLVGVNDMTAFNAWKDEAVSKVLSSGPIYPDKVNAPWLKLDNIAKLIEDACADIVEVAYLVVVEHADLMRAITLCRDDVEAIDISQEKLEELEAKVHSLSKEVDGLYCKDCGDLIASQFSRLHPGTCYCQNCYDKHNSD